MKSIKYSDDETIVKDYNAAKIKKPSRGEVHIVLTNKRLIINYQTPEDVLISDVKIDDVRGTDISWSTIKKIMHGLISLAIGITLIVIGIVVSSLDQWEVGIGYIVTGIPFIAVGIYFLIKKRTTIIIIIYTKAIVATLSFHNLPSGFLEKSLTQKKINLEGKLGQDAEIMAQEIGVIIQDIQKSNKQNTD